MERIDKSDVGRRNTRNHRHRGFTVVEALVSVVVLSFGVLSLAGVYTQGIVFAGMAKWDYIAQKKAEAAVETIFTARDTQLLTWAQIQNVAGTSGTDGGVFLDGPQPLLDPGPDGLIGTADDIAAIPDTVIIGPGPDNVLGTPDDLVVVLNTVMTREIQIVPVPNEPNLRQITITIKYTIGNTRKVYTLISYVSAFA
ncbi:MAG TPA: prepilin-type N-terminal cleavage/methylation domain-containing protein [Candidatus Acidoferrum sp.]|nr:prepilin-type N-terminal cleavage/methylation domain-containing protein [Candidatus Dormibacteraeota bacterium]HXN51905.1 prepilin-type N-terminal cleavage/methylation domain-containing protein [Candidatus Acidoferrum sp.]